jgi:hypothetical protein
VPAAALQELEQRQAEEEARQEEACLAAEQARLTAAFESEQQKEKAKGSGMGAEVEGQVAGAWSAAKQATVQARRKSMDDRRRSQGEANCHRCHSFSCSCRVEGRDQQVPCDSIERRTSSCCLVQSRQSTQDSKLASLW